MEKKTNEDVFKTLASVNVSGYTKSKDTGSARLTYLTWSKAWELLKQKFSDVTYVVHKNENGLPYFASELGIMVYTSMTINGQTYEMQLPVMDGANRALKTTPQVFKKINKSTKQEYEIEVPSATMNDINKTVMRCLTKNIAMFGLGLHVYEGEDIPMAEIEEIKQIERENNIATLVNYVNMAQTPNQLSEMYNSNQWAKKEEAFMNALYNKLEFFIKGAPNTEYLAATYQVNQWAHSNPNVGDWMNARATVLTQEASIS